MDCSRYGVRRVETEEDEEDIEGGGHDLVLGPVELSRETLCEIRMMCTWPIER